MAYRRYYRGPNVIWLIIAVNIVLFIATMINQEWLFFLGLQPAIFSDRPWTILTSMFVHAGFWHILANMWTLYFFGTYLSQLIGIKRFLLVYFVGGILGGVFYLLLAPPYTTAVGASGAIFALGGTLVIMRPKLPVYVFPIPVALPLWGVIIGGFFIISPGIAWQGHLGGLVLGVIAGYFFRRRERHTGFV